MKCGPMGSRENKQYSPGFYPFRTDVLEARTSLRWRHRNLDRELMGNAFVRPEDYTTLRHCLPNRRHFITCADGFDG